MSRHKQFAAVPPRGENLKMPRIVFLLVLAGLVTGGCNPKPPPPPNPKTRFQGVTIKVLIPASDAIATWLDDQCGEWTAETAGQVEKEAVAIADVVSPRGSIPGSALAEQSDTTGDVLVFPSAQISNVVAANLATRLSKEIIETPEYERLDIARAVHDQIIDWDRQQVGFPISAECMLLYYRADLFGDETLRAAYQEKFDRPLEPPATWDDFDRLAEFFNGQDLNGDQVPDYGAAISSAGDALLCRAAAYGKVPQNFSFYFDVNSLEPLATGPAFSIALTKWVELSKFLSPNREISDRSLSSFSDGRAAMAIGSSQHAAQWFRSEPRGPMKVAGRVGCMPLPGSTRVYQHDKQTWVDLPSGTVNRTTIISGLVGSVAKNCRNSAAAIDLLMFLTNRERSLPSVTTAAYGFGPYRLSHVVDSAAWSAAGWQSAGTSSYLSATKFSLSQANAVAMLRIDASDRYHQALDETAAAALAGDKTATEALVAVAEAWKKISAERGVDRQRRSYRYSLGMPVVN